MHSNIDMTISFLVKSLPKLYNEFYLEYIKMFIQDKNVNKTQLRALTFLKNYGSISMGELCYMLNIEKGSMTSMIDDLEKKNYVERTKDKKDRRKYTISLTSEGEKLSKEFLDYFKVELQNKMGEIDGDKIDDYFNSLKTLILTIENIDSK